MKIDAEIEMTHLQAKEYQGLLAATKSWKKHGGFFLELLEGTQPCCHLSFRLLASRNRREYISVVLCDHVGRLRINKEITAPLVRRLTHLFYYFGVHEASSKTGQERFLFSMKILDMKSAFHATTNRSSVEGKQSRLTPPVEANTSQSVPVATKAVLTCPPVGLTNVLIIRWEINLRDKPSCIRAYRRDNNETSERNCTDERISWESRPDQNPALQIDPVATTHDGYYRCEVAAPDGNFGFGYHLQVLVPPEVTLFRGSNGTLVCRAAGKPAAQISWTPGGDCHTAEQQLGNGTVTVLSTCHWEDRQVSNVSCSVSHVTGNKTVSLELNPGVITLEFPASALLIILYVKFSLFLVILVIVGFIYFQRINDCRDYETDITSEDSNHRYKSISMIVPEELLVM
ncbi:cell surface glycoprotein CD200 receptor 2-like [Neomonachus schauinslandi]|uniref:Cell surface glycoprotein CD200 receptor 2-like n=1 Tax=Neomonachus schauinslandi TaxID=29088 RepID=A0A8M1MPP1_NEOSC|nr:cell surface glycoprotein CD200 receptor 2-like [Neomonachus schauinslandi]